MQKSTKSLLALALIVLVVFSADTVLLFQSKPAVDKDTLFQVAAFNTFSMGNYTGVMTYSELGKHGDFGIGTFDGLNGEMIALNGVFYQIPSDGVPREVNASMTAPYATVTYFHVDQTFTVSNLNYTQLKTRIDDALTSQGVIYAIKVTGTFGYAQTRSPAKQTQPYPLLADALKTQSIFNLNSVSATAAGFWFPSNMNGVDYAGYHLHLITDDHSAGGHMLDCIIQNATVEIEHINNYRLILP